MFIMNELVQLMAPEGAMSYVKLLVFQLFDE